MSNIRKLHPPGSKPRTKAVSAEELQRLERNKEEARQNIETLCTTANKVLDFWNRTKDLGDWFEGPPSITNAINTMARELDIAFDLYVDCDAEFDEACRSIPSGDA